MSEVVSETLQIQDSTATTTITLDGDKAQVDIGGGTVGKQPPKPTHPGQLSVNDTFGNPRVQIAAQAGKLKPGVAGFITAYGPTGKQYFHFGSDGKLDVGGDGSNGALELHTPADDLSQRSTVLLQAGDTDVPAQGGRIILFGKGAAITAQPTVIVQGGDSLIPTKAVPNPEEDGKIALFRKGAQSKSNNQASVLLQASTTNDNFGSVQVGCPGVTGLIFVRDNKGVVRITLDGNAGDVILSNADCAEEFDVSEAEAIEPGTVMVLNDDGSLRKSSVEYDRKVAGVISGAGAYRPAIVLDKQPGGEKRAPLAMLGKVYCKVDADYAPIEVGDLLTTSPTPGSAMRAADPSRAFGAVIGKALRALRRGQDLIPILIALQ
jgi:hypothetical protein